MLRLPKSKKHTMLWRRNTILIRTKTRGRRTDLQRHKPPMKFYPTRRKRKLGINTVRRHLIKAQGLTQVEAVEEGRLVVPPEEALSKAFQAALERISTSKICSGHLQEGAGGAGAHANHHSRKKFWLAKTSKYKRTYLSWMQRRVRVKIFISHHSYPVRLVLEMAWRKASHDQLATSVAAQARGFSLFRLDFKWLVHAITVLDKGWWFREEENVAPVTETESSESARLLMLTYREVLKMECAFGSLGREMHHLLARLRIRMRDRHEETSTSSLG